MGREYVKITFRLDKKQSGDREKQLMLTMPMKVVAPVFRPVQGSKGGCKRAFDSERLEGSLGLQRG